MGTATEGLQLSPAEEAAVAELEARWEERASGWDMDIENGRLNEAGLWNDMPEIDSKEVARLLPILGGHLGIEPDVDMIQDGGYSDFQEMAKDLITKARAKQAEEATAEQAS